MSDIAIRRAEDVGMIQVRGAAEVLGPALGPAMPPVRGRARADDGTWLWFGPDELLWRGARGRVADRLAALSDALSGTHHLALDVSDARAVFHLDGPEARLREAVAKLSPTDIAPGAFGPGDVRRTRLAQVAAAVWMPGEGRLEVLCFRSVAAYVRRLLTVAADPAAAVGHF